MANQEDGLKQRTKTFALRVVRLVNALPKTRTADVIGRQLLRSGTSVGANYRSACRSRTKPDFVSRISIAAEEADESLYWMELLVEANVIKQDQLAPLLLEGNELVANLTSSEKTARRNMVQAKHLSSKDH